MQSLALCLLHLDIVINILNPRQGCGQLLQLWAQEAKRFRPTMFASCHLKLRDTETYDVCHGLRILDHRMPPHKSPEPPKRGPKTGYIAIKPHL